MPSSISSSDTAPALALAPPPPAAPRHALAPGLRLTAADRPGVAQPVPERDVPPRPWLAIAAAAMLIALSLSGLWEWRMRTLELAPGDISDSAPLWAQQRRRIDAEPVQAAIVGDSRILFDTNLDRFQRLTGVRPVQLALPGTNGRPFLEDLADDPKFKGLAIVGMAETSYFRKGAGLMKDALEHGHWESPATRVSYLIHEVVARRLALLDEDYSLSNLVARLDPDWRSGVEGPRHDVWKIQTTMADRQSWLWPRIEHDQRLRDHARFAWDGFRGKPITPAAIAMTEQRTAAAVAKIRARGGDVVFVRPPSAPQLRVNEEARLPRAKGWDALLAAAHAGGVHFDDLPAAQGLTIPEWSHLTRACAVVFTDAYVRRLTGLTPKLRLRADAPPPLGPKDCVA